MIRENGIFSLGIVAAIVCMSAVLHADEKQATVTYSIGIKGMTCERCVARASHGGKSWQKHIDFLCRIPDYVSIITGKKGCA